MKSKMYFAILAILFTFKGPLTAQNTLENSRKLDSLFTHWQLENYPGGVVLVTKKGLPLIFKAYGMASVTYGVPISKQTRFNIGSVSKQFTAMGIVLLASQNKLSFNDDIRTYLPDLPDFGSIITIRHLLYHTSGLRDIHGLLALAGWRANDLETNDDLFRLLKYQKTLNFTPGDEFLYSNTGYILLAKIIENLSGQPFDIWMQQQVFSPLGMKHTQVETAINGHPEKSATSYTGEDQLKPVNPYWGYYGAGNVYSTAEDLELWLQNFIRPQMGWAVAFKTLETMKPLNNGYNTQYGLGIRIEHYLGTKVIQHGGAVGGFRAVVRSFPEEELNIILLSNFSNSRIGTLVNRLSHMFIKTREKDLDTSNKTPTKLAETYISLSENSSKLIEGIYWNASEKIGRTVFFKNDTLYYSSSKAHKWPLLPLNDSIFRMQHPSNPLVKFDIKHREMRIEIANEIPGVFTWLQADHNIRPQTLSKWIGHYYSSELKTMYSITLEESELYIEHARHGKLKLKQQYDTVYTGEWPVNCVEFETTEKGEVTGLKISNGRTRDVYFAKWDGIDMR